MGPPSLSPFTVLYDRDCNFCMVVTDAILSWDRADRLRAIAIQDPEGQAMLPHLTAGQRLESVHLVAPDGTVTSGGAVLPQLLQMLPGGKGLALPLTRLPGVTDAGYKWVARNRITISKAVPQHLKARARTRLRPRTAAAPPPPPTA